MRNKQAWWRWVVVAGGCMCGILVFGILNAGGVIYVGVLSTYNVSHAEAAWVTLLAQSLTNLVGPIAALLGAAYSYRKMVIAAGIMSCISLVLSFFTTQVAFLILTYGVLLGVGLGFAVTPTIITVGMHFEKHRAVANGICFAGSAIGSFIIPSLLEYLREQYGLRGTFLIMAGIVLNISVCGSLYRPAPIRTEEKPLRTIKEEECSPFIAKNNVDTITEHNRTYNVLNSNSSKTSDDSCDIRVVKTTPQLFTKVPDVKNVSGCEIKKSGEDDPLIKNGGQIRSVIVETMPLRKGTGSNENGCDVRLAAMAPVVDTSTRQPTTVCCGGRFSFFSDGFFVLIACGWSCLLFSLSCILLIMPDYAITTLDGVSKADAALLVSAFAVGDLIGRLGYGWLADLRLYPSKYGYMVSIMTAGTACLVAPLCTSYTGLMAVSAMYGLGVGCTIIQHPGLMIEYLGMEVFKRGYGFLSAFAGLFIMAMTPVVGALRESTGSYIANFLLTGGILMTAGLLWLLEPLALRRQMRNAALVTIADNA